MLEWTVIKTAVIAFFKSTKALFVLGFVILILFLLLAHSCKKEKPTVEVITTPPASSHVVQAATQNLDQTLGGDQKKSAETGKKVEEVKKTRHAKVKAISADTTTTPEQKEVATASADMDALETVYYSYYAKPAPPNPTPPS